MVWYILKIFISAGLIVLISEVSKKLPLLGSLIASLPLVSVLGMIWLYGETKDVTRIADHAEGTFWYVLPSLPMFLLMPMDAAKRIFFYCCFVCGNRTHWCALLFDDQSSGKIWNEPVNLI